MEGVSATDSSVFPATSLSYSIDTSPTEKGYQGKTSLLLTSQELSSTADYVSLQTQHVFAEDILHAGNHLLLLYFTSFSLTQSELIMLPIMQMLPTPLQATPRMVCRSWHRIVPSMAAPQVVQHLSLQGLNWVASMSDPASSNCPDITCLNLGSATNLQYL